MRSTTHGTLAAKAVDKSRDGRLKAINESAQSKKLLTVERLSADASKHYPDDAVFKLINARALLDLGRTKAATQMLKQFLPVSAHREEAKFLTAIALLSDLQRSGDNQLEAQKLFVQATTLLYEVVQTNPNFKDRFPPNTHINQVRQGLTQYTKAMDFEQLSVEALGSEIAVLAMLDVLKRLNKHSIVRNLLKAAHLKYPDSNSLWLSRAELHLTQNEPLVALEFINQVKTFQDLNSEELLTYAAGQIAAAKQLKSPGILPFARSYRALIIAEGLPEDSVFKTLIPRVKKTIFGLLPKGIEAHSTETLSPVEKTAFLRMIKDAGLKNKTIP
jgi:predicted Zn-dependent protease